MYHKLFILLAGLGTVTAQVYTPPAGNNNNNRDRVPAAPRASQNGNTSDPGATFYGNEVPFLDPNQETISIAGRTFPLADTRLLAARYEKYLNEPADDTEPSRKYRALIKKIIETVSPLKPGEPGEKLRTALHMLPLAAQYEGDAEQSTALSNAIHTAYISKADVRDKKNSIKQLEVEKRRTVRNMSVIEKRTSIASSKGVNLKESGNQKGQRSQTTRQNDVEYDYMKRRLDEIDVLRKKYEGEGAMSVVQSKIFYQAQLVHYALQRRFEHAKIGCSASNIIFHDGDSKLRLDKGSDAAKVFGETVGMPPTVSTLETFSNEAIRDTIRAVESVKQLLANKRLTAANKRLAEAYFIGEFLEPIRTLELEEKQRLFNYIVDLRALKSSMEGRDFGTARELTAKLKMQSTDFDAAIVMPLIEMAVQASDLHLLNAQQAMMQKDVEKAQAEIKEALTIWPMNPSMKDLQKTLATSSELIVAKNDFERLLHEENYRQIFREQYRFAPVVAGDPVMEDAFKQIIQNIAKIEGAIQLARESTRVGQHYAAWEELKRMNEVKTFSKDPELGNEIVKLTPQVSELAKSLDKAMELENKGEAGSSLAWYIKMQSIYPKSKYASEGIERLRGKIFASTETSADSVPAL